MNHHHRSILVSILVASAAVTATPVRAEWVDGGTLISAHAHSQQVQGAVSDGAGGAFIVWRDFRDDNWDIYVQRIDGLGEAVWTYGGIPASAASGAQIYPRMIADGSGGVIITWQDARGADADVYAQRLDSAGNFLWAPDGVAVCAAAGDQEYPELASDGAGGAIIAWSDERGGGADVYAQRVGSNGTVRWTVNGIAVSAATGNQQYPMLVDDGEGGAVVAWRDGRFGNEDIFIQRVTSHGDVMWTADGVVVCTEAGSQRSPRLLRYEAALTFVTWEDNRGGDWDIYMQRFDASGDDEWKTGGIVLCATTGDQYDHSMVRDTGGGAIVTWKDSRGGADFDIYAQRMSSTGSRLWGAYGIGLCTVPNDQLYPEIVADGVGGAIVAWQDLRNDDGDVYAQRVDANGNALWTPDGVAVATGSDYAGLQVVACDGDRGAIVTFSKAPALGMEEDCYAQRIEKNGYWGYPAPSISHVSDVPGDQGGFVTVAWQASRLDPWPEQKIAYYTVWRSAPVATSQQPRLEEAPSGVAGTSWSWEVVDTVDAHHLESYAKTVPTLNDSTAADPAVHYFQVIAHGFETGEAWVSQPDSGWSVDNIAPAAPQNLVGTQSVTPEGLMLAWDRNTEPDLAHYSVYRDTATSFVPDESNLIAAPADTFFFDGEWRWNSGYHYKVSATDLHGNEGAYTSLDPEDVTGIESPLVSYAFALYQNCPNPFNPTTKITFSTEEASHISLCIYDAAGHLVRRLSEGTRAAGRHEEIWDGRDNGGRDVASGVYFYRFVAGNYTATQKMVLLR
jgi:hypothetical protein